MRWLAFFALLLAGCPAGDQDLIILDERFEDQLAGWTVTGDVTTVTTIHPAEHGLLVRGTTEMLRPLSWPIYDEYSDGQWLEYSTNCGGAPELWVVDRGDGSFDLHASIPITWPTDGEFERVYASAPPVPLPSTLNALLLDFESADGPCVLDNLRLYQPANLSGY